MVRVRIPQITSIDIALRLYYSRIELSGNDIKELFGAIGTSTVVKLKNKARELMKEHGTPIWNAQNVNTEVAFEAWGLNIADLEKRQKKLAAINERISG